MLQKKEPQISVYIVKKEVNILRPFIYSVSPWQWFYLLEEFTIKGVGAILEVLEASDQIFSAGFLISQIQFSTTLIS